MRAYTLLKPSAAEALREATHFLQQVAKALSDGTVGGLVEYAGHAQEVELRGYVESLSKLQGADSGKVVVLGQTGPTVAITRINLELSARDYLQALEAHRASLAVACTGRLVSGGARLVLREVREFRVLRR